MAFFRKSKKKEPEKKEYFEEKDVSMHCYIEEPGQFEIDEDNPPLVLPQQGFRVELGGSEPGFPEDCSLEDANKNSLYYDRYFYNQNHVNFLGGDAMTPVIVSVSLVPDQGMFRTIVRTKRDDFLLNVPQTKSVGNVLKSLQAMLPQVLGDVKLKKIKDPDNKLSRKLRHMEDRLLIKSYKLGIIYCKEGQKEEDDMFSNEHGSDLFNEFLDMLGERVKLQGFRGFRGGLDVDNNTTGEETVVTKFQGYELMFHVSTLLPFSPDNKQQVERKRHIGNDVVAIIFQDGPAQFTPQTITSKFNHIYCIVQVDQTTLGTGQPVRYKIAVVSKPGVRPHSPALPSEPVFEHGEYFREFLLSKMINAERAAYYAPGFAVSRTRRLWMKEILEEFGK